MTLSPFETDFLSTVNDNCDAIIVFFSDTHIMQDLCYNGKQGAESDGRLLLAGVTPTGEIHLKRERHYDSRSIERMMVSERREYLREVKDKLLAKQYGIIIIP